MSDPWDSASGAMAWLATEAAIRSGVSAFRCSVKLSTGVDAATGDTEWVATLRHPGDHHRHPGIRLLRTSYEPMLALAKLAVAIADEWPVCRR